MSCSDHNFPARLHSAYHPQIEAERYIDALNVPNDITNFILIEPGMGYLISALKKKCPGCTMAALHADTAFRETEKLYPDIPQWFPGGATGVQEFLEAAIPNDVPARIIEWRPSLRYYGESYLNLVRECSDFLKRAEASRRTGVAFGKRWIRNFFRNLGLLHNTLLYSVTDTPIVITGAGPSLEAALPKIAEARKKVFILAASSSLPALAAGGIIPDMIIGTDGGGWALFHLYACSRGAAVTPSRESVLLAIAMTAAVPSQCSAMQFLPMNDGSLWQNMALKAAGIPTVIIPQRGTVTASALELAMIISRGNIFLVGMDLTVSDIKSHSRPYGFDYIFNGSATRLRPVYSQIFVRSNDIKEGGSFDIYAAWFKSRIASWPKRIFSLGGNHIVLDENLPVQPIYGGKSDAAAVKQYCFKEFIPPVPPDRRCAAAVDVLCDELKGPRSQELVGELAPLLLPQKYSTETAADNIIEMLRDISRSYRI